MTKKNTWDKAKKIIPGGNNFFSKRPDNFLGDNGWPTYYKKSKGCEIWTTDNKHFIDMSLMGVGPCVLGYANDEVNAAVIHSIENGIVSTLNAPEEIELAERLVSINPWADMAKFTKSGGEANAVAIRIARAAAKNSIVGVCGYHGWHDWYLAANLSETNSLNNHLMTGLKSKGVIEELANYIHTFEYNDINAVEDLIVNKGVGIIKMEVRRNIAPEENFLMSVRNLCTKHDVILIFDECTSGFRENFGGLHQSYNVFPDIAMFGKAIGNGHPICAVIGKREIMNKANDSFISSTFWSERLGFAASLKTLEIMERDRTFEIIPSIGRGIKKSWKKLSKKYNLDLDIGGLDSMPNFVFKSMHNNHYKSFITEFMLKEGFLATNTVYISTAHTPDKVSSYIEALEKAFKIISDVFPGKTLHDQMEFSDASEGFKRMN
ncbi:aminotransferase class III-fold pyridoxal phosphate-dependent enzyme [Gammaproteobacteria bacterium]|nr:aminotransferase class III-fold pyridoxal phosphate-dependent enzyme [Gammaproteobacteria bacterium]